MNNSSRESVTATASPLPQTAEPSAAWHTSRHDNLPAAIAEFKAALPGWWFSIAECQVSCDASCAPTAESPDIALAEHGNPFDHGFHADLPQPSTMAAALRDVMGQAIAALAEIYRGAPLPRIEGSFVLPAYEAKARLADAAPDMFEALRAVLDDFGALEPSTIFPPEHQRHSFQIARAALAKALGEPSACEAAQVER